MIHPKCTDIAAMPREDREALFVDYAALAGVDNRQARRDAALAGRRVDVIEQYMREYARMAKDREVPLGELTDMFDNHAVDVRLV